MAYHHESDPLLKLLSEKRSPLIDQTANPVRTGVPPTTQPLTSTGGARVGQQDMAPGPTVDAIEIPHVHRHEGTKEGIRPYFHAHPHRHAIAHDPDDPNDVVDHDRSDHLNDPRHIAAIRGFGGWEAKSAGASAADALKAVQGDSVKVQAYVNDRGVPLGMINERLASNSEAMRQLSMSAELAELRKMARPTQGKRAAAKTISMVAKSAHADTAKRHAMAENAKSLAPALKLADELRALYPLLEHPDHGIRKGAQELRAQKLADLERFGRVSVTKATAPDINTEQIARAVREAVDKSMRNLGLQIGDLKRRAR